MEKLTGFIITAGHLDIEWYQPLRSYRFWTVEAFKELIRIYKTRNGFKTYCLDGQYYPLKEYLDVVPEDEPTVREMIRDGLLSIGPFYTQFDEWLPSAESIIRNCLYGDRLCKKFGGYMRAGYLPDNFGHPLQMPVGCLRAQGSVYPQSASRERLFLHGSPTWHTGPTLY